jgi:hypothetical protein
LSSNAAQSTKLSKGGHGTARPLWWGTRQPFLIDKKHKNNYSFPAMITISFYRQGIKHQYTSSTMELAYAHKRLLIKMYGRSAFHGVSWFTVERSEDKDKGFLQKPAF